MAGRFGSVVTAMVTPFREDHAVDYDGAQELASHLLDNGSDAVVVAGSTGESPTLTHKEKAELFRVVAEVLATVYAAKRRGVRPSWSPRSDLAGAIA